MHRVFHSIRFKVNKGWSTAVLLFLCPYVMRAKQNKRVLLGMSGGTDSSVAAIILQDAGYEVTGITFRFYEKDAHTEYLDDAAELCTRLHIPHLVYDAREIFQQRIITYFINEYLKGRTPVPCTLCNNLLKWPLLQQVADEQDIYHIATGHYVQKVLHNGRWHISAGSDPDKDQSFFLWGLSQETLQRMLLPMGNLTKKEVRALAAERGFTKMAHKRDSQGVCFCPGDYRTFLRKHTEAGKIVPGIFYNEAGIPIGTHEGYPFYTIGQRRRLGIYQNQALFVKQIIPETNAVIICNRLQALEHNGMYLSHWYLACPDEVIGSNDEIIVKIRYRKQANRCRVTLTADNRLHVCLHEPLASIACGQAAVFYRDNIVLGGGFIDAVVE